MTTPIPLSDPQGRVYAYACGTCHHVASPASLLVCVDPPGPIPELVEMCLERTAECCTCRTCGALNPRGSRMLRLCDPCFSWMRFCQSWSLLGVALSKGIRTQEEWSAWCNREDDE